MTSINPRSSWTTSSWGGTTYRVPISTRTEFMLHWEGGSPTHDTGAVAMQSIDSMHRGRGWFGIGYNFVGMQDGNLWEGRGWGLVGAHCPGHNRVGIGVQMHVGGDAQEPTRELSASIVSLYEQACHRSGRRLRVLGHRDGYATECPGNRIEEWLRGGMLLDGRPPGVSSPPPQPIPGSPAPAYPLPSGSYFGPRLPLSNARSVSGYYSHRADLARWQSRMLQRGWDIRSDGLYGPQTAGVARGFQREKHLGVDSLIGPVTWRAAWESPIT